MADPSTIVDVAGLQLSNNTFSASPPGSLRIANNIVINNKGVGEHRNGQAWQAVVDSGALWIPFAMADFIGQVIVNSSKGLAMAGDYKLGYVNGSSVASYSGAPFTPVGPRMQFAAFSRFTNFCTTAGPKVLEAYNGTPRASGLLRMPDCVAGPSLVKAPDAVLLPYNTSVAYRTVLRRTTSNGVSLLSPPSGRAIAVNRILVPKGGLVRVSNVVTATLPTTRKPEQLAIGDTFTLTPGEANFAAGTYTVTGKTATTFTYASIAANAVSTLPQDADCGIRASGVSAALPIDAVAGDFLRLYRSLVSSVGSSSPDDEMYLVAEIKLQSGQIPSRQASFTDNVPQSALVDPLYSNPQTGEGSAQVNLQPPLYRDVTSWNQMLWFSNTKGQHELRIQMLGVGSPDGVQDGDTITIDGNVFTFKTSAPNPLLNEVQLYDDDLPSVNIEKTTQALCSFAATNGPGLDGEIMLYSGDNGSILIQRCDFGAQFAVRVSRPTSWTPSMSSSSDTLSDNSPQQNQLAYSKLAQGEAVPPVNFLAIGSANFGISRIIGLRESLLIFKAGDGIYSVSGQAPFLVNQISTANITAPGACAQFADAAWVYTDQGILRVSDSGGCSVVSRQIETELNRLFALSPDDTEDYAIAVPYEVERRIMFFVPSDAQDVDGRPAMTCFCYCNATQAWTKLEFNEVPYCGVVSQRKLELGVWDETNQTGRVTQERKGQSPAYLDKADANWTNQITVANVDGNPLWVQFLTPVNIGSGVQQGQWRSKVVSFVHSSNVYEVADNIPWADAGEDCSIYEPYPVAINWQPQGSPSSRKALTRMTTLYQPESFTNVSGQVTLSTDQMQAVAEIAAPSLGFGRSMFGIDPFGDSSPLVVDSNPIDAPWANAAQFFPGFEFNEAWCTFRIQGVHLRLEGADAPTGRGK